MGEWREFLHARRYRLTYRTILYGTFVLTVVFDLTVAVEVGLALACLFFIVRMSQQFQVVDQAEDVPGVKVFNLVGTLFFGAVGSVEDLDERVPTDSRLVILNLRGLLWLDTSGLEALRHLQSALAARGQQLCLVQAEPQPLSLLQRSGAAPALGWDERPLDEVLNAWAPTTDMPSKEPGA